MDLGGRNIAAAIVDLDAKSTVKKKSIKTNAPRSCEAICKDIDSLCRELCMMAGIEMQDIRWIGAVAPGIVKDGNVVFAANLGWKNAPFEKTLASMTKKPVFVDNDANGAAYAEALWGAGEGARSLVAVTLGTGVGGGIVIDKTIWKGINGFAGEIGHIPVSRDGRACGCGFTGCLESYCSAIALTKETKRIMKLYPESLMWKICDGDIERVNGKTAFIAASKRDTAAKIVINSFVDYLAVGVSTIINMLQPDVVCIGGGVSREGDSLLIPLRRRVERATFGIGDSRTKIVKAVFENDAGIFGAALLGLQGEKTKTMTREEIVLQSFDLKGNFVSAERYGSGHINDTRLAIMEEDGVEKHYILQRINHNVFKKPEELMANFAAVTAYLREIIIKNGGDPERETINLIKTKDGANVLKTEDGEFWRLMLFITNSVSYDKVERPEQFYSSAVSFGNFQYLLREFPADTLYETIPNFHNTPDRLDKFEEAVAADVCGRRDSVKEEIEFVRNRKEFANTLEKAHSEGKLPLRVTHNDTKLNNILFDDKSGKALAVIDLDTIMPGYSVNDFGDSIRFGATTALEDEADLSKVNFDISLYELYVKGFIEGAKGGLTEGELEMLPIGAIMMTFECGTRFLTDYLSGDTYFRTSRPGHNLDRARNQFKLVSDMEARLDEMRAIVKKYAK